MAMAFIGGGARQLVACVKYTAFGAGPHGVYYVPCDLSSDPLVHVMDLGTGASEHLSNSETSH